MNNWYNIEAEELEKEFNDEVVEFMAWEEEQKKEADAYYDYIANNGK